MLSLCIHRNERPSSHNYRKKQQKWVFVFQRTGTIFELNSQKTAPLTGDINKKNVCTKFRDDWTKIGAPKVLTRKTAPPTGGHVFQLLTRFFCFWTYFELDQGIIGEHHLTKFHEDRTRNVASVVFTRKTAPPTGGNFLTRQYPLLTKFHEERTGNVASRVLTNKCGRTDGRTDRQTTEKDRSQKLT
ncbi:hypothetical protein DPMN_161226 [Dreissena polymorpha]|uniref:Uncharacterized protein n=1 Tax=Dreissena polymorpha TaxID=45954 RepID=A0A9D4IPH0_DREPO|nr:hypothetical protein DPMN_161226 [Dreissena polymorpha]